MTPLRIQLSRKRGWRMPPDTRKVSRPTKFGNRRRLVPDGINRFSLDESISVRIPSRISEKLRREAEREGIPLSRYCGNIIAKTFDEAERKS